MKLRTKFQDEDFELGEVVDAIISTTSLVDTHIKLKAKAKRGGEHTFSFNRISELFELFEDYDEPKGYYYIRPESLTIGYSPISNSRSCKNRKEIGNYFETKEEAEKAVEKLKAWKRLKDKGFRFNGYSRYDWNGDKSPAISFEYPDFDELFDNEQVVAALGICFGGEE